MNEDTNYLVALLNLSPFLRIFLFPNLSSRVPSSFATANTYVTILRDHPVVLYETCTSRLKKHWKESREEQKSKLVLYFSYWYKISCVSVCACVFVPLLTELGHGSTQLFMSPARPAGQRILRLSQRAPFMLSNPLPVAPSDAVRWRWCCSSTSENIAIVDLSPPPNP
jgi:hypothetical protein